MEPQISDNIKDVCSQLTAVMDTPVGISRAMAKIDKKLIPILKNFFKSPERQNGDLTFTPLFEWMMQPKRIVEEFIYVLGPLVPYVQLQMTEHRRQEGKKLSFSNSGLMYIGMIALEALSVKCPVLDGNWEIVVWLILKRMKIMYCDMYFSGPSDRLSTWIIHLIGDADVCPNAHLRIELIKLLEMVDMDKIGVHIRTQAFNAVMDACSNLSHDYLARNDWGHLNCSPDGKCHIEFISDREYDYLISGSETGSGDNLNNGSRVRKGNQRNYNGCSFIRFGTIVTIFNHITEEGELWTDYSQRLENKLNDVNSTRLSSIVHDYTYSCGVNPNKYTEPRELQSLISLLNTTGGSFQEEFHKVEKYMYSYRFCKDRKETAMDMFEILIKDFRKCHQKPQLIYPAASFIINVMEFNLASNFYNPTECWSEDIKDLDATCVVYFDYILQKLLIGRSSNTIDITPIGRELISRYGSRLKRLKELYGDFDNFPTIYSLMKHV